MSLKLVVNNQPNPHLNFTQKEIDKLERFLQRMTTVESKRADVENFNNVTNKGDE